MSQEKDYILGTHDEEITRLGLQHRVWRPRSLDAWRRAGITVGQTILDVGCGPGYASLDLAEIVGPAGRVVSVDRSRRFLDALEAKRKERGLTNIETYELDLDDGELPVVGADAAWSRWIFAFVKKPKALLSKVASSIRRGGVFVLHEYIDYGTWRLAPPSVEMEEFVAAVMAAWRESGGEPDIGLEIPHWLEHAGFEIMSLDPIIDVVPASNYIWQWPAAFVESGLKRMVDLGKLTPGRARELGEAFAANAKAPHTLMITPAVVEIIALRT